MKKVPAKKKAKAKAIDYSTAKLIDLPTCADGTPRKKEFVLWIIEKLNATLPKRVERTLGKKIAPSAKK